jgi:hypothetical protein
VRQSQSRKFEHAADERQHLDVGHALGHELELVRAELGLGSVHAALVDEARDLAVIVGRRVLHHRAADQPARAEHAPPRSVPHDRRRDPHHARDAGGGERREARHRGRAERGAEDVGLLDPERVHRREHVARRPTRSGSRRGRSSR